MMHLAILFIAFVLAWGLRGFEIPATSIPQRWQRSLIAFILPPALILAAIAAVLSMGARGMMMGLETGWLGYLLAVSSSILVAIVLLQLSWQGWQMRRHARTYPQISLAGETLRQVDVTFPYSACIGFWRPEIVITTGLLELLDSAHIEAVIAHERAHAQYRDTFWFFWLGWLRRWSAFLPRTETLWQELLLLREIRADARAARASDPLLLAESLLAVARFSVESPDVCCAPLSCAAPSQRLQERIDALFEETDSSPSLPWWYWCWSLVVVLPLLTIPLHH